MTLTTTCGWLSKQYHRLSRIFYWGQISLFNHVLNHLIWKSISHVASNEVMIVTFQNTFFHLSKGTTILPCSKQSLEFTLLSPSPLHLICQWPLPVLLPMTLKIWSIISIIITPAYSADISHPHDSDQLLFVSLLALFSTSSVLVLFKDSKKYISFSYFNTSEIGMHLTISWWHFKISLALFSFFFLSNFNISEL